MSNVQWPSDLLFLQALVRKYVPADPRRTNQLLEAATQAEWEELNAAIMQLLRSNELAQYRRLIECLAKDEPAEHARVVALVGAIMPIRGAGPR